MRWLAIVVVALVLAIAGCALFGVKVSVACGVCNSEMQCVSTDGSPWGCASVCMGGSCSCVLDYPCGGWGKWVSVFAIGHVAGIDKLNDKLATVVNRAGLIQAVREWNPRAKLTIDGEVVPLESPWAAGVALSR
jgi:hypothetical protein